MPARRQYSEAHPVWSIAEVVREVMEQNAENAGTLARCARVSHVFSDTALEVLWRELEGLGPLLSILRKSVKHVDMPLHDMPNVLHKRYLISGPIDDAEWNRFQHYANLVRSYKTNTDRMDGIFSATLLDKSAGEPLLPRLTSFKWTTEDEFSSAFLLFLSPSLRTVHVNFFSLGAALSFGSAPTPEDHTTAAALRLVYARAPNLETLHMQACHMGSLEPLSLFVNIRSLKIIQSNDPRLCEKIASSLPALEDLTMQMFTQMRDEDVVRTARLAQAAHFGQLVRLELLADPRMVPIILDHLHAPLLKHLQLRMELKDHLCVRVCEIAASRFSQSIRTFLLQLDDDYDNMASRNFSALYSPLYAMRGLEDVDLSMHFETPIDATAADVARIAEAWPNLTRLTLPFTFSYSEFYIPRRMPITALETFARRCPKLELLVMQMPDPKPLDNLDLATVPRYASRLSRLHLLCGEWHPHEVERAKLYLGQLFPSATVLFDDDFDD